jgi:hypothetical protein
MKVYPSNGTPYSYSSVEDKDVHNCNDWTMDEFMHPEGERLYQERKAREAAAKRKTAKEKRRLDKQISKIKATATKTA